MGAVLSLVKPNLHLVDVERGQVLFHVPTSGLFELDPLSGELIRLLTEDTHSTIETVEKRFQNRYSTDQLAEAIEELKALKIVTDGGTAQINADPVKVDQFPLNTVILNVNTGCNLSCTYCYKEDLEIPSKGQKMAFETAVKSVEMLLEESPDQDKYNIVFFGGEPLSNMPLIRQTVEYCQQRFQSVKGRVDFTLTTNGTLLTEELVDYFNTNGIGLTISMDGPKAIHDKNRITVGGQGTYDVVNSKVKMLLPRYSARPVGVRVTLTRAITDVEAIYQHLYHDLGFHEVGFAPVTSGDMAEFNLTVDELHEVFEGMKRLGRRYLQGALAHQNTGFGNMHQLMTDLHEGNKKSLPCGAGVALLAVDTEGGLNLCHRFTGSELPLFGDVDQGIDKPALSQFIEARLERADTGCETCRIRNLCSGGCYHESYAKFGDPAAPAYHYCDLMRDWIDFGIEIYSRIMIENPEFFDAYVTPRRSS
ncbi:quinohemoprotein amine dehydrogenase maturation protein [Motiliproteus sp. MSK22-1]|uniref:quinohemoprotein amine dehydrogenase maturation protein n=1 Tax=Motiliproteus sp. MSK22-1 TaxID=1897630 RepID=UPI0009755CCB|nr:quinohemoprotein amine dehydrogenase maturation protein [Motiliproteus sp. MSK22-1]OMH29053.1 quinohemoprotein amine dehydrogenase maturation protein [Motiliproteus sp. MSK22-1]